MDQSMVIVQLLPTLDNGGVERGTIEVANYLAACGHQSIVISAGGRMLNQLSQQVEHIRLEVGKKSLLTLFLIKRLQRLFIEKKVDIVHARSRLPAWLAFKAIAKMNDGKPKFITTIHGLYSVKRYSSIMARGDRVIAVSRTAANYVMENYGQYLQAKPQIINRGINPEEFPFNFQPDVMWLQIWYQKHHQLVGHQVVLLPGRLTSLKGVKELEIWLKSCDNDAKLVLTADPENDTYAARLNYWFSEIGVINRVVWVGLQSAMAELYAIADVVVSPSVRPESFGRTVIESLAVATPVVGYNHGGVGDILENIFPDGKVQLGNKQQLSDKINKTLEHKPKIDDMQLYLLDNMLSQTTELYQKTLSGHV